VGHYQAVEHILQESDHGWRYSEQLYTKYSWQSRGKKVCTNLQRPLFAALVLPVHGRLQKEDGAGLETRLGYYPSAHEVSHGKDRGQTRSQENGSISPAKNPHGRNLFVFTYVDSLRGPEGLLVDLEGCRQNFLKGLEENYVIIAHFGIVKGEHGERQHLLPTASVTGSGIKVRRWMFLAANQMCG
jgi:hypothetical protein